MNKTWLDTCITAGEFLYGEYPVSVLKQLYETRGEKITVAELLNFFDTGSMMVCDGEMVSPMIATEGDVLRMFKDADAAGNPYASLHYDLDELQVLRKENAIIEGQPYWIPKASQIEELMDQGFIRTRQYDDLVKVIVSHEGNPSALPAIWAEISTAKIEGIDVVQIIIDRTEMVFNFKSENDLNDINNAIKPIMDFVNFVNLRQRKGWPPSELSKRTPKYRGTPTIVPGRAGIAKSLKEAEPELRALGMNVDYSSIDSFATVGPYGERRAVKVGRNDPCPCGSGKKYKYCHGR